MQELFHKTIDILIDIISQLGYLGIFFGMLIESTPIPIPSELIMIPAGIAATKGIFNIYIVTFLGILGNVIGAAICYHISFIFGHKFIVRFGKYFFLKESAINKMQLFFARHGSLSVFIGRLLPGFRHFISIPAGLAKMNFKLFYLYTILGSTIWTSILSMIGYIVGDNQEIIEQNLSMIMVAIIVIIKLIILVYFLYKKYQKHNNFI